MGTGDHKTFRQIIYHITTTITTITTTTTTTSSTIMAVAVEVTCSSKQKAKIEEWIEFVKNFPVLNYEYNFEVTINEDEGKFMMKANNQYFCGSFERLVDEGGFKAVFVSLNNTN